MILSDKEKEGDLDGTYAIEIPRNPLNLCYNFSNFTSVVFCFSEAFITLGA